MTADFIPQDIGQLFGQEHLTELLCSWCENINQIPKTVLLHGPYGTGKTSAARMLASRLVTDDHDLVKVDSGQTRGIDDMRSLVDSARFSPRGSNRVFIMDEMHKLTKDAQSALLLALEDALPPRTYFFLCTTEPQGLLHTIVSRCTKLGFRLLTEEATCELLSFVTKGVLPRDIMVQIHNMSGGHARDAVKFARTAMTSGTQALSSQGLYTVTGHVGPLAKDWIGAVLLDKHYINQMPIATLLNDEQTLATVLDEVIDSSFPTHPVVRENYYELLGMRACKRMFQITAKEQFLHFLSVMGRD